jgi:hypothetical protein
VKALTVTLGNLNLGIVADFNFSNSKRFEDVDLPAARGSSTQDLGEHATEIQLSGVLTGPSRFNDFRQLQRVCQLGQSLKMDCDVAQTVVFIREVKLAKTGFNFLRYSLTLKESMFKQVNACDAITSWFTATEGASVTIAESQPLPFEGRGCLKVSHDAEADEELNVAYEPVDTFNLEDFDWISFAFLINDVAAISSAVVTVQEGENEAYYDFIAELAAADEWRRIRIHKTQFADYDAVDWSQLSKIKFAITKNQARSYFFAVDDMGGYE